MSATQPAAGQSPSQRSTLSGVMPIVAIFVAVWVVALLYWKTASHVPAARDLLLYGLALPTLLATSFGLVRKAIAREVPRPAAGSAAAPVGDAQAQARPCTIALLDCCLRLPAGITPEDAGGAARAASIVGLHTELKRRNGVKIFAASVASIELDQFDETLLAEDRARTLDGEQRRALLLAAEALDELMERRPIERDSTGGNGPGNDARETALYRLHVVLPQRWRAHAGTLAAWLDARLARERWMPRIERASLVCVTDPVQALAVLDDLSVALQKQPASTPHILLALDSTLGQRTVDTLDNLGQLYRQAHPDGHVLGEGACALLLAHPDATAAASAARVHRLAADMLSNPAEQAAQQRGDTITQLLDAARKQAAMPELEIASCALVSDADQRSSRRAEVTSVVEAGWPDKKTREHCLHLGLANGEVHAALALSTIAVAGAHSLAEHQPTFALSSADGIARGVMLVTPPPIQVDALPA